MDASPLFDPKYLPIIVGTLVGFGLLAALLLVPISRFLDREQEVAKDWTPEALAERIRERRQAATNGAASTERDDSPSSEQGDADSAPSPS